MKMKDKNNNMVTRRVARFLPLYLFTFLPLLWSCSSDSDDHQSTDNSIHATFTKAAKPSWAIDWSSNAVAPDWQDPASTEFECSMDLLVNMEEQYLPYSTDNDMVAIFYGDECRGVSYRNVMADGGVTYLLHAKGSSEEIGQPMNLRFYCDQLHLITIPEWKPLFTPNNLTFDAHQLKLTLQNGNSKYPYRTYVIVKHTKELPFYLTKDDMWGAFIGDECVGIGKAYLYENFSWQFEVYCKDFTQLAELRYYSADKGGIYTFNTQIPLNGNFLIVEVDF
jgi:hypothetical protein